MLKGKLHELQDVKKVMRWSDEQSPISRKEEH